MQDKYTYAEIAISKSVKHLERVMDSMPVPHVPSDKKNKLSDKQRAVAMIRANEDLEIANYFNLPLFMLSKISDVQARLAQLSVVTVPTSKDDLYKLHNHLTTIASKLRDLASICAIGQGVNPDKSQNIKEM